MQSNIVREGLFFFHQKAVNSLLLIYMVFAILGFPFFFPFFFLSSAHAQERPITVFWRVVYSGMTPWVIWPFWEISSCVVDDSN